MEKGTTLTRFIVEEERRYPEATGEFTGLLSELTIAGKIIARDVNKAGLAEVMGITGRRNIHGEEVQKLDEFANETILRGTDHTGHLAGMASEEMEDYFPIPDKHIQGNYILVLDPVDGSSNIDVNVSIGTIFSIFRKKSATGVGIEDFLRPGSEQLCAGYILYGSSTVLVYTTGSGVHGFTLDPTLGEFLLSHENITFQAKSSYYSVNEGNYQRWNDKVQRLVEELKTPSKLGYSGRYIGSLVADFHRNLLKGGIYLYPADTKEKNGKLRLLYEASPLAFIAEQAGGKASDGVQRIMDITPTDLHQRTPLFIGNAADVDRAVTYLA
jgi:fructose-1,6-bisphosphatase I